MGRKAKMGQVTNNPLLLRRMKARPHSGPTIKDYLARPRPTLDEVHKIMKERDAKNLQLERWETEQGRDWRSTLDQHRMQIMKEKAKKERKELKEARKEEKRLKKLKRRLRKGKLTEAEIKDYKKKKRKFKKRVGEMQLSQWLQEAEAEDEQEEKESVERNAADGGEGEPKEGEEPPLKRPKVAWVFKDMATQTQWKREKENGRVVMETNPAPAPASGGGDGSPDAFSQSLLGMPGGPFLFMQQQMQQQSQAQLQALQQQAMGLQQALATQPLLQLDQRLQMQRQIIALQQQMQMHMQRAQFSPFSSLPFPAKHTQSLQAGQQFPHLPTPAGAGQESAAIAAAVVASMLQGRPKRRFASTLEASQGLPSERQPDSPSGATSGEEEDPTTPPNEVEELTSDNT